MKILRTIIKSTAESGLTGHRASLRLVFTACESGLWEPTGRGHQFPITGMNYSYGCWGRVPMVAVMDRRLYDEREIRLSPAPR